MNVILSKDAKKQYDRLPIAEQKKVKKKLKVLEHDPHAGKKLTGDLQDIRSLRVWSYRILYEINEAEQRIEIHKIKHRQGVYK